MHVLKKFPDPDGVSDHSRNPIISVLLHSGPFLKMSSKYINSLLSYVVVCHGQMDNQPNQTNHPRLGGDNNISI